MARARHNSFVLSFRLLIGLWVVSGCYELICAEMRAKRCEEVTGALRAIFC